MLCLQYNAHVAFVYVDDERRQHRQGTDWPDLHKYVAGRCWKNTTHTKARLTRSTEICCRSWWKKTTQTKGRLTWFTAICCRSFMTKDNIDEGPTDLIYSNMLQIVHDKRQHRRRADWPDLQQYVAGRCCHFAWGSVLLLDVSYRLWHVWCK